MDGFTACRILKENEETRLIPILFMTALAATEDRIKGIEAGADDFLTKPVDERELAARIQTSLKLKQAMDRRIGELSRVKDHFKKFVPETVKKTGGRQSRRPGPGRQTGAGCLGSLSRHQRLHPLE